MSPNKKIKNPRKPKTQKMVEEEEQKINETETSDNSNSDDSKNPENEANEYEKQRQLRIDRNKAKMEAMGLRKIANSLMHLSGNRNSNHKSKRIVKNSKDDDEYEPNEEDPDDDNSNSDCSLDSSSEEFEKEGKRKKKKKQEKMVKNRKLMSDKQKSLKKQPCIMNFMDDDDALKQAIALSLKDIGEASDLHNAGLSQSPTEQATSAYGKSYDHSREDKNTRRKKRSFNSRVQMTEDDLVINFCQFDEVGKGSITLRDLQRMAASHDFTWTDKELVDMIHCFDSDRDGKLTLDDFRNIILRCNMLQLLENP